ncbi:predicted protein [Naegleria gruberi]|uniref:leucine--tRNA ligase n=1 Tax=Naegleria gruberi TaxID=5762 RepID=D2UXZ9_NAEGR|nr:uncharacterized protein NAEGRDRAFT_77735 [Naegleria gruberi]EFC50382.1 predicted protein [Naegleria gruberi]|eukprot:XP_002683126.1 predicted protein [Naegleria gruberi strain NEG-M]
MSTTEAKETKVQQAKGTAKRDFLIDIEKKYQQEWEDNHIYESSASDLENKEKFFATFPYPYMNGRLHLGHAFSMTKAEFQTRFQRLLGKNVLFPFGFHCTGMPIAACADRLKREIEDFGNPPKFPDVQVKKTDDDEKVEDESAEVKTGEYQWNIMRKNGLSDEDIAKFADAKYWLEYFPPLAKKDLQRFGVACDFRRSFITTDLNPYYDSFIRWQFNQLKEQGRISFGKRYSIFSPKDNQLCADHDRAVGEGAKPQEYTVVKLFLQKPYPKVLEHLQDKRVYLGAATLRPETMFGQTNCWLLPDGEYGAFETNNGEVIICTARAARNLAWQELSPRPGEVVQLAKFLGADLMGAAVDAPMSPLKTIHVLPMMSISTRKTTGVVTSVPSDAPADFAALQDLKNKADLRTKFNIKEEYLHDPIPIIEVPEYGTLCAPALCEKYKIKSQNDKDGLEKAKDEAYLLGFSKGVFVMEGEFKGMSVKDTKNRIRQKLLDEGMAVPYAEPDKEVISRSGDRCVVSLTDQWYLAYGEEEWKNVVMNHLKTKFHVYNSATINELESTVEWLKEWGCSRSYGLGTKLPWDEQFLIESLSDSTIYMAYYTVAHLLQGGVLDGSGQSPAGVKPEQLTDDIWSYIFHGKPLTSTNGINQEVLDSLRKEFQYWYPVDLRVSGKDLIKNHLTMFLYNHAAIFPDQMPGSIFANGYVMVNGEKMSKQAGNFLTLQGVIEMYGADATRLALCDSGDTHDDANFEQNNANSAVLKLNTFLEWIEETLTKGDMRDEESEYLFADKIFDAKMNLYVTESKKHYEAMVYKEVFKTVWVSMQDALSKYIETMKRDSIKLHKKLILRFIELQSIILSPVLPHCTEHIWKEYLKKDGSIVNTKWPVVPAADESLLLSDEYLKDALHKFRQSFQKESKAKKKALKAYIYVADKYLDWQIKSLEILSKHKESFHDKEKEDAAMKVISQELKEFMKFKPMPFVALKKEQYKKDGDSALSTELPFNEFELLNSNINLIKACFGDIEVEIYSLSQTYPDPLKRATRAQPMDPSFGVEWEK